MIKNINGNVLHSRADVIIHQVNCLGFMGAGIAAQIRKLSPQNYK